MIQGNKTRGRTSLLGTLEMHCNYKVVHFFFDMTHSLYWVLNDRTLQSHMELRIGKRNFEKLLKRMFQKFLKIEFWKWYLK